MKKEVKSKDFLHISFELGLLLKGIYGLLEIIGGVLLLFLNPSRLSNLMFLLTQHIVLVLSKDSIYTLSIASQPSNRIFFFGNLQQILNGNIIMTTYGCKSKNGRRMLNIIKNKSV